MSSKCWFSSLCSTLNMCPNSSSSYRRENAAELARASYLAFRSVSMNSAAFAITRSPPRPLGPTHFALWFPRRACRSKPPNYSDDHERFGERSDRGRDCPAAERPESPNRVTEISRARLRFDRSIWAESTLVRPDRSDAGDVCGQEVDAVSVEVAAGAVVVLGGSGVGVAGEDLGVA